MDPLDLHLALDPKPAYHGDEGDTLDAQVQGCQRLRLRPQRSRQ